MADLGVQSAAPLQPTAETLFKEWMLKQKSGRDATWETDVELYEVLKAKPKRCRYCCVAVSFSLHDDARLLREASLDREIPNSVWNASEGKSYNPKNVCNADRLCQFMRLNFEQAEYEQFILCTVDGTTVPELGHPEVCGIAARDAALTPEMEAAGPDVYLGEAPAFIVHAVGLHLLSNKERYASMTAADRVDLLECAVAAWQRQAGRSEWADVPSSLLHRAALPISVMPCSADGQKQTAGPLVAQRAAHRFNVLREPRAQLAVECPRRQQNGNVDMG